MFRRLGQIENALGIKLFERHRTGYVLTAAGEEMVALADRLDDDITAFTRKLAGSEMVPAGELRVTTNNSLLVHLLTPLFARLPAQICPDIRLDLVLSNQPLNLSQRDADVAIRATDKPPETLVGRRVARIAWALYGRSERFPRSGAAVSRRRCSSGRWISLGDTFGTCKVVRYAREHVAPERIVYKVNTVLGLAEAVEAGLGIGHLPCFIADKRPGLRRLSPVDETSARILAADASRPARFGAGAGVPRFPRRGDRQAQAADRGAEHGDDGVERGIFRRHHRA